VLVLHDLIGMTFGRLPRFVRQYANLREIMTDAIQRWSNDVKTNAYPNDQESYGLTKETLDELISRLKKGSGAE
jgi:3-methyl-2-oxobutanoate hydroxymethyltransferase